jgi:hypothetical protein
MMAGLSVAALGIAGCCGHERHATQSELGYTDSYASYPPPNLTDNPLQSYASYPPPDVGENWDVRPGQYPEAQPAGGRLDQDDLDRNRDD